MAGKFIENHQARQLFPAVEEKECANKGDIVNYVRKNVVKKVGEGEDDFVIEEIVVEESRVNRQAYIAKDSPDVGIMNILEKVRRSGDVTLFNQTHALIPEGLQDYTNVPKSIGEALKSVELGANSFEGLKAIFGDVTFDQLATMSEADLNARFAAYLASLQSKTEGENK